MKTKGAIAQIPVSIKKILNLPFSFLAKIVKTIPSMRNVNPKNAINGKKVLSNEKDIKNKTNKRMKTIIKE